MSAKSKFIKIKTNSDYMLYLKPVIYKILSKILDLRDGNFQ